jgi:hypothetical protein
MSKKVDKSLKNAISNEGSLDKATNSSKYSLFNEKNPYFDKLSNDFIIDKKTSYPKKFKDDVEENTVEFYHKALQVLYSRIDLAVAIQQSSENSHLGFDFRRINFFAEFTNLWLNDIDTAVKSTLIVSHGYFFNSERETWFKDEKTLLDISNLCRNLHKNPPTDEEHTEEGLRLHWCLTLNGKKVSVAFQKKSDELIVLDDYYSHLDGSAEVPFIFEKKALVSKSIKYIVTIGFSDYKGGFSMLFVNPLDPVLPMPCQSIVWYAMYLAYFDTDENKIALKELIDKINALRNVKSDAPSWITTQVREIMTLDADTFENLFMEYFITIETVRNTSEVSEKLNVLEKTFGKRQNAIAMDLSPVLLDLSAIPEEKPISKKRKRELEVMEKEVLTETPSKKKAPETPPLRRSARLCECGKTTPCKEPVLQSSKIKALGASSAEKAYKQSLKSYFQKHPEAKKRNNELNKPLPKNKKAKKN